MRGTYDADAAYLYVVDAVADGVAERTIVGVRDVHGDGPAEFDLDLDSRGRLLGIEILNASASLRPETLARCERIDDGR